MEQLGQRIGATAPSPRAGRAAAAVTGLLVIAAIVVVVALRIANRDAEPEGQNWWLVSWSATSLAFGVSGAALASRPGRRLLGASFTVVGLGAALTAVATQYGGYRRSHGGTSWWDWLADVDAWSRPLAAGVLVGVVPWLMPPRSERERRRVVVAGATSLAVVMAAVASAADWSLWAGDGADWLVAVSAAAGVVELAGRWWRGRRRSPDPLPAWVLAGALAAFGAVVPERVGVGEWTLAGRDVVSAVLLLATVPLLVGGAVVDTMRDRTQPILGVSNRVLEWVVLATGIVAVYTGAVAGLGRLVGGSGPTWLLVTATGAIALLLEPARRHVHDLVDRLVYGGRDDPLAVVQRVVDHLGADAGDDLLPALVENLRDELCLDTVGIDLRVDDGWQHGAWTGPPAGRHRVVVLRRRGEVVGRLVVGWADGPSLRRRDEEILAQLVGPLSLAVGWVRLTEDLRRSRVAVVSAREEERRRLRRDLHDGLGPSLTGVSLGLRTALRQLARGDGNASTRPLLGRIAEEVDVSIVDLKRIVRDLRPTALDQLGLLGAVAEFARGLGDDLDITLALPQEVVPLPAAVEVATYRIVAEAVTNVVRHAHADRCWLSIETGPTVVIDVVDDGVGIGDPGRSGVGLTAMRERAAELGGTVHVLRQAPRGTRVHVQLPAALP